jgi:hypothetical protein
MDFVAVPDSTVPDSTVPDSPSGSGREPSEHELSLLYEAGEPVATMRFRILKYLPPNKNSRESR